MVRGKKHLLVGHVFKKLAVLHEVCKWRRDQKGDGILKIKVDPLSPKNERGYKQWKQELWL